MEHNHIVIKCTPKKGAEAEIRERISDIALGMRAEDYLELPPMMVSDRAVELPEKTMRRYRQFEKDSVLEFRKATDGADRSVVAAGAAALMNKLSQMANGAVYTEEGGWQAVHAEKLRALDEVVEEAGGPVLCFYAYKHDLERIQARYGGKMEVRKYEGAGDLADWDAGKIDLLLAHPASTAYGLNMQKGGHTAVWFSTGWNLELYDQANARLHRQGQEKPVTVVNLVARGDGRRADGGGAAEQERRPEGDDGGGVGAGARGARVKDEIKKNCLKILLFKKIALSLHCQTRAL